MAWAVRRLYKHIGALFFHLMLLILIYSCGGASNLAKSLGQSIFIATSSNYVNVGSTLAFTATTSSSAGENITNSVTWTSSHTEIASISATGVVTGLTTGTTMITALQGSSTSNSVVVTVRSASALSISIPVASQSLGTSQQLSALVTLTDGTSQDVSSQATWSSSNTGVLSVSSSGLATASTAGTATVTAVYNGFQNSSSLSVSNGSVPVSTLVIYPGTPLVIVGGTQQLTVKSINTDGSTSIIPPSSLTWSSASGATATVSASGLVTGVAAGLTTITGTYGAVTASVFLTVKSSASRRIYSAASGSAFRYCDLNASGVVVTPCSTTGSSLTTANPDVVIGNYLYAEYNNGATHQILACPFDTNTGNITGSCNNTGASGLPAANINPVVFYGSSYAYVNSGTNIYKCINVNLNAGTIGSCSFAANYTGTPAFSRLAINGNYLYAAQGNFGLTVYMCAINPSDGTLSNCGFTGSANNLSGITFIGNYAYLSPWTATTLQVCTVNPNGTLYPCVSSGNNISSAISVVSDNNKIYVSNYSSNNITSCSVDTSTGLLNSCSISAVNSMLNLWFLALF